MLTLYHSPTAVCAAKVRVVLAEKGLRWDGVVLDLGRGDQFDPAYLKLNTNGSVPTLVHQDAVVTDSTVINEYLDEVFTDVPMRPADPLGRAGMRLWTKREDGVHAAINTVTNAIVFRPDLQRKSAAERGARIDGIPDPIRRAKWHDIVDKGLDSRNVSAALVTFARQFWAMEDALAPGPWLVGTQFTLADAGLTSFFSRLRHLTLDFMWLDSFPRVAAWFERCLQRPSFGAGIGQYFTSNYIEHYRQCGDLLNPAVRAQFAEARQAG